MNAEKIEQLKQDIVNMQCFVRDYQTEIKEIKNVLESFHIAIGLKEQEIANIEKDIKREIQN